MKYLLDADQIIWYLKGRQDIVGLLQGLGKENLRISVVALAEVLEGIYGQRDEKGKLTALGKFLTGPKIIQVDEQIARQFAKIRSNLRKRGKLIDNMDIFIAATVLIHNLVLITGNKKDFEKVEGLKIYKD